MHRSKASTDRKTIFSESAGCSPILFISFLGVVAISGLIIHLLYPGFDAMPWAPIKLGCWLITGFFAVGFFVGAGIFNEVPQGIVFDHQKGLVIIQMKKSNGLTGHIPYSEVKKLDIHIRESSSKDGKTTKHYYGYFEKIDGGKWSFVDSLSAETVSKTIEELRKKMLSSPSSHTFEKPALSKSLSVEESPDVSLIYWTNKFAWRTVQLVVYTILYFGILIFGAIWFMQSQIGEKFAIVAMAIFIFPIMGWLLFRVAKRNLKNMFLRFAISINRTHLEYFEFTKKLGKQQAKISLPITQIQAVRYDYLSWNNLKRPIEIIGKEPLIKPFLLYLDSLNPVECLHVETWMQETLKSKSGEYLPVVCLFPGR